MAFKFLGDICRRGLSSAALDETLNRWGWRPLLADQIEEAMQGNSTMPTYSTADGNVYQIGGMSNSTAPGACEPTIRAYASHATFAEAGQRPPRRAALTRARERPLRRVGCRR